MRPRRRTPVACTGVLVTCAAVGCRGQPLDDAPRPSDLMNGAFACGVPATRNIPAEPDYSADHLERWRTFDGCDVRLDFVMTRTGGCFEGVDDILIGWPPGDSHAGPDQAHRSFIRDPAAVTSNAAAFEDDAVLPSNAVDSGLRWDVYGLWLVPANEDAVWLEAPDHVERWPRGEVPCA